LDQGVRSYVERCCDHLYVREYANTVLFLAHHTSDQFVTDAISCALQKLFAEINPITFSGDTKNLGQLVEAAPKLNYTGEKPEEHRRERNLVRDSVDNSGDGLLDAEEQSDQLSKVAQLTMLFKTTEILGQVLKNQY